MKFRYVGVGPETLGSGRPLAPGDAVDLDPVGQADRHNSRLITEGKLLPIPARKSAPKTSIRKKAQVDKSIAISGPLTTEREDSK